MRKFDFKKLIIALLISSMMLSMFVACTDGNENDPTDTTPPDNATDSTETEVVETYLDIVKDGELVPVIYGSMASAKEITLAKNIIDRLNSIVGVSGRPQSETTHDPNKVEILVGNTTYPESQQLLAEIGYGQSAIKVIGNKLVVVGSDVIALELAINTLVGEFNQIKDENKNIRIKTDYSSFFASNELVAKMPVHPDYSPDVVNCDRDCYMMDFGENKEKLFREYIELLEKNGFELYAENVIEGNEYYTYVTEELVVTAIYTKYNRVCKMLVENREKAGLAPREEDNVYTPVEGLKSSITQVGLFYDVKVDEKGAMTNFNGMCYVIRLDDGSFIVVDGGHGTQTQADHIYETMKLQAPDPDNIVIAAWFFSHNHGDHITTFVPFVNTYKDKVTIESFIYNFPSDEQGNSTAGTQQTVESYISGFFKNAKVIKAHPGQVYHIRNAKITMLYTMDVYESDTLSDTNNTSIVWQMELEGKTFMCLGDYSENSYHLLKLYTKETLKSDIVQIAHHGISGQSGAVYEVIAPEYAFWPVGAYHVIFYSGTSMPDLQLDKLAFNDYFTKKMDQKKVFLAADDFVVMTIDNGNITTETFDNDEDFYKNYKD